MSDQLDKHERVTTTINTSTIHQAIMRPEALGDEWATNNSDYIPESIKEEVLRLRSSIIALFTKLEDQERFEGEFKPYIYKRLNEICMNIARGFTDIQIGIGENAYRASVWRDFVTEEKFDYFGNGLENLRFAQQSLTRLSESLPDNSSSFASL